MALTAEGLQAGPTRVVEDRSAPITATAITFIILITVATALRVVSRHFQKTKWTWADLFMPFSLLFNLGVCTTVLLGVRYGAGKHLWDIPFLSLIAFAKTAYFGIPLTYIMAVTFSKLAVLDVYLKVFVSKPWRVVTYTCGGLIIISMIVNTFVVVFQCRPIAKAWNPFLPGICNNLHEQYTWGSLPNIVTDVIMLILPIPTVMKLNQGWKVKAGVFMTFLVGSLGLITSIARLVQFYYKPADAIDGTWSAGPVLIWTIIEPGAYHLAACALSFRHLSKLVFHSCLPYLRRKSPGKSVQSNNIPVDANGDEDHFRLRDATSEKHFVVDRGISRRSEESFDDVDLESGTKNHPVVEPRGIITVRQDFQIFSYHQRDSSRKDMQQGLTTRST